MSIFVVLSQENNPLLEAKIAEKFPLDYYKLTSTQWVISSKETVKQLSDKLEITIETTKNGPIGSAIIFSISTYWGRASNDFWEWIKVKMEKSDG
jgi:hypothetical protein